MDKLKSHNHSSNTHSMHSGHVSIHSNESHNPVHNGHSHTAGKHKKKKDNNTRKMLLIVFIIVLFIGAGFAIYRHKSSTVINPPIDFSNKNDYNVKNNIRDKILKFGIWPKN